MAPSTHVLALGAEDKIRQIESALGQRDDGFEFHFMDDHALDLDGSTPFDVALIVPGDDTSDRASSLLDAARGVGLPAVVVLPRVDLFGIDPAASVTEICFAPVRVEEIALRLRAAFLRSDRRRSQRVIRVGPLAIDEERYEVTLDGRKIDLTYKEYELLKILASNPGRVFSRESLLRTVWEYDYFGGTRTVDVHVRRLRSKIDDVNHRFIETVWNVGYRFRVPEDADASA